MGEAKRRKKLLGKDYGEKPPVLVAGTHQFQRHLHKFLEAWSQKLAELEAVSELDKEQEVIIEPEEIHQWLKSYLGKYRDVEREKLVMEIINPSYEEILVAAERNKIDEEWAWDWSMDTLSVYELFKPYLSDVSARIYSKPLIGFYQTVIREALEDSLGEIEKQGYLKEIKSEFERILEIEEAERY